jgi:DNA (cytosine-5)-methyltransferase 1
MELTFGSLFAGIGGIDLGFERAGMVCKWQVEIDPYCQKVLAKHWPDVRRHDDVRTWPQPDTEPVDVIAGGFPCQDISYAGKGAGLAGERSGLFYEVARIVSEMGPRFVVLENVAALLTRGMGDVLGTLASLGYDAEWHCIPAAAVGAPHIRDRVFILAYARRDTAWTSKELDGQAPKRSKRIVDAGDGSLYAENVADSNGSGLEKRQGENSSGTRPICGGKPSRSSQWDFEPAVGRVAHGVSNRVDRLRGLGNAVVPQVAEWIGRQIVDANTRSHHE